MITSHLMGGLGNYLFQIAAGYSKSLDLNQEFYISDLVPKTHREIQTYFTNILRKIKIDNDFECSGTFNEPLFHYIDIPDFTSCTKLYGYFQSEKYFIKNKENILKLFEIPHHLKEKLYDKYPFLNYENTCSIHVRRGDYLSLQEYHPVQEIDYYKKSISIVGEKNFYIIFSDDMEWCKNNFNFIQNKFFCEGNEDYEDLYLISLCKDNINANSSFSWWGSWLNPNENKKIIFPKNWFGPALRHYSTESIYPENSIIL